MSEAKYTKGPWQIVCADEYADCQIITELGHGLGITPALGVPVAAPYDDAQLIAAAPELLEALQWVVADAASDTPEMWSAARAAIAKALGEQP